MSTSTEKNVENHEQSSSLPWLLPHFVDFWWISLSQTYITSTFWLLLFVIFVIIYNNIKKFNPKNFFVNIVEMFVEWVYKFFWELTHGLPRYASMYVIFLFFYILWNNYIWLVWDLFAVWPNGLAFIHHYFRPVTSDISFNFIMAFVWVTLPLFYWFRVHGIHFLEKYFPVKWMWIFQWNILLKAADIFIWLFVWLLELISEFARLLSLSLRLFWNIFAWIILLTLLVSATVTFIKVPFLSPLIIMALESLVWLIQALVFALLVSVYFKVAWTSH